MILMYYKFFILHNIVINKLYIIYILKNFNNYIFAYIILMIKIWINLPAELVDGGQMNWNFSKWLFIAVGGPKYAILPPGASKTRVVIKSRISCLGWWRVAITSNRSNWRR